MDLITERTCRACGGPLDTILHLGDLAVAAFPAPGEPRPSRAPLDWCACAHCRLVQLRHTVDPTVLFTRQYWYRSGVNETMRAELADVVHAAIARVGSPGYRDLIMDVGANDGTLLAVYRDRADLRTASWRDTPRVAFEPARSLQAALALHAEVRIADFFPEGLRTLGGAAGRVRVLTSIACFYDLDDPRAFVGAVDRLLAPDGVWVVQFQDLWQMVEATAFDNIVAEHLVYYSLASFARLLEGTDLHVTAAEPRAINGGSYRLFVQRRQKPVDRSVATIYTFEAGVEDWHTLERFAWRVSEVRRQITSLVGGLASAGLVIDLYAASTKANTLLQYCGLGPEAIRQAWERSPEKVGRTTATGIPIVSEATGRVDPPNALLLGAWGFRDAFMAREAAFLAAGGSMIVPLPTVDLITQRGPTDFGNFWEDDDALPAPKV